MEDPDLEETVPEEACIKEYVGVESDGMIVFTDELLKKILPLSEIRGIDGWYVADYSTLNKRQELILHIKPTNHGCPHIKIVIDYSDRRHTNDRDVYLNYIKSSSINLAGT